MEYLALGEKNSIMPIRPLFKGAKKPNKDVKGGTNGFISPKKFEKKGPQRLPRVDVRTRLRLKARDVIIRRLKNQILKELNKHKEIVMRLVVFLISSIALMPILLPCYVSHIFIQKSRPCIKPIYKPYLE